MVDPHPETPWNNAVFNVMEILVPEYSAFGAVREAAGSALRDIAPSNAYRCAVGFVLIVGDGDSIFRRLMDTIGRADLAAASDVANNAARVARVTELDRASVPAGMVYTAADIVRDRHYRARDMILSQATRDGHPVEVPGIVPKLLGTPGTVRSSAPGWGDDTDRVLAELALDAAAIARLRREGWWRDDLNTRGLALANVLAAIEAEARRSSLRRLGRRARQLSVCTGRGGDIRSEELVGVFLHLDNHHLMLILMRSGGIPCEPPSISTKP